MKVRYEPVAQSLEYDLITYAIKHGAIEQGYRLCRAVEVAPAQGLVPRGAIDCLLAIAAREADVGLYNDSQFPHNEIVAAIEAVQTWCDGLPAQGVDMPDEVAETIEAELRRAKETIILTWPSPIPAHQLERINAIDAALAWVKAQRKGE